MYKLYKNTTTYNDYTELTYFVNSSEKVDKKFKAVTLDNGARMRQNLETGELSYYTIEERELSIKQSIDRTRSLVFGLCDANSFEWFITLTFDPNKIDRTNPEIVVKAYQQWIKKLARICPTLRYVTVPELHEDKSGQEEKCIHFHILMGGISPKQLQLVNSGKVCCSWATFNNGYTRANKSVSLDHFNQTKDQHLLHLPDGTTCLPKSTDGMPLYNVESFVYGLTTASKIVDKNKTSSYVMTYVQKGFESMASLFGFKRVYYSHNLNVPDSVQEILKIMDKPINSFKYVKEKEDLYKYKGYDEVTYSINERYNSVKIRVDNNLLKSINYYNDKHLNLLNSEELDKINLDDIF